MTVLGGRDFVSQDMLKTIQKYILYLLWYILPRASIPRHIAIIMDGNRRFARKNELSDVTFGHRAGCDKMLEVVQWCIAVGVRETTVYAFSLENFKRPKDEVEGLMELAREKFQEMLTHRDSLIKTGARVRIIGRVSALPRDLQDVVRQLEEASENNNKFTLNICVAYLSTEEMVHSISTLKSCKSSRGVTEREIDNNMYTSPSPAPALVLRTSGERRLSNFLLWQCSHSILLFERVYWPEFSFYKFILVLAHYHFSPRVNVLD